MQRWVICLVFDCYCFYRDNTKPWWAVLHECIICRLPANCRGREWHQNYVTYKSDGNNMSNSLITTFNLRLIAPPMSQSSYNCLGFWINIDCLNRRSYWYSRGEAQNCGTFFSPLSILLLVSCFAVNPVVIYSYEGKGNECKFSRKVLDYTIRH